MSNLKLGDNQMKKATEDKFQMVLKSAMNAPGVRIIRADFLEKELSRKFPSDIVQKAIQTTPAAAGINISDLETIAQGCIQYETNKAVALSTIAGIPGGFAMALTVPGDTIQYFGHIIRIVEKLIYLYGWDELYNSNGEFDDETMSQLTLFIGVMFGVNGAASAVTKLASSMAMKVEKTIAQKTLTKGWLYPIVKKIAQIMGLKMTKNIFAKGVSKIIPLIGGVISGGLTYVTYKPLAKKLKEYLETLPNADVAAQTRKYDNCDKPTSYDGEIVDLY